ncbi:MAG: toll/interleukin-1 receptor domain-containing protein, partial [Synergistaceae bacterium]|nr:toll/interleukin-1 receptor domain-containing protein [Synergistaceae bacterium]
MSPQSEACKVIPCNLEEKEFVFVSYAHSDAEVVYPIIEGINADGYPVWYDKGINISSTWTDEIARAIMGCGIFIVFVSRESVASSYVRSEIEFAFNNKIKIIPVYLDGMEVLPPGLAMGLNATQGITDIKTPRKIVSQICEALVYNNVPHRDKKNTDVKYKKYKDVHPRRRPAPLYAGIIAAAIIIGFMYWNARNSAVGGAGVTVNPRGFSFSLGKSSYIPAEPVMVDVSDLTQKMIDDGAVVGICKTVAKQGEYISYEYIRQKEERIKLRAPLDTGEYEVRGYTNGNAMTESTLAGAAAFTVEGDSMGAFSATLVKSRFSPQESFMVNVNGVTKFMQEYGAFVGIYKEGAAPDTFIVYQPISGMSQQVQFNAPNETGKYE